MTHDEVPGLARPLHRGLASYEPAAIGDLFASDATYRFHPWRTRPFVGREAIVALAGSTNATTRAAGTRGTSPYAIEDDRAAVIGESRYTNPDGSLRELVFNPGRFASMTTGRCVDFVEYFMELPDRTRVAKRQRR